MKVLSNKTINQTVVIDILLDIGALAAIYLIPATVHLTGIPVYMIEPMRLMLILSMAHASKYNTFLLALSLPLFSFVVSGHPELIKMFIITGELVINVALFYWFLNRYKQAFLAVFISIIISKIACYLAYWPIFSFQFMVAEADLQFIIIQFITTLVFSLYISIILKRQVL